MQHKKIRTDYKSSMTNHKSRSTKPWLLKGKWPFALGLLTFALVWRFAPAWQVPTEPETEILHRSSETLIIAPKSDTSIKTVEIENIPLGKATELAAEDLTSNLSTLTETVAVEKNASPIENDTLEATLSSPKRHISSYTIKEGSSLAYYLSKENIPAVELHRILHSIEHANQLKKIFPGQIIQIETDEPGTLRSLSLKIDATQELKITKNPDQRYISTLIEKPIEKKVVFKSGIINDSLFLTGKQAKVSEKLIMELAQIFEYDIDFALDIKPKDHFKILYEDYFVEGKKIGHGPILTAEFGANGKTYQAMRYTNKSGKSAYYSLKGESLKKAFIRTPVQYTRISSHFNLQRKHPILHKIRAHKGVDYAAPYGTPVKASGSGKVIFVGRKGGYGNAVILQHGQKYSTLYAHLQKFARGLREGQKVSQGQVIGYVGSTGLASGPHLHYEFRIHGAHKNPLTVPLPNGKPIPKSELADFRQHSKLYLSLLEETENTMVATKE